MHSSKQHFNHSSVFPPLFLGWISSLGPTTSLTTLKNGFAHFLGIACRDQALSWTPPMTSLTTRKNIFFCTFPGGCLPIQAPSDVTRPLNKSSQCRCIVLCISERRARAHCRLMFIVRACCYVASAARDNVAMRTQSLSQAIVKALGHISSPTKLAIMNSFAYFLEKKQHVTRIETRDEHGKRLEKTGLQTKTTKTTSILTSAPQLGSPEGAGGFPSCLQMIITSSR